MPLTKLRERSPQLFRCRHPQVADDAAMHRVRVIKTDNLTCEVCTVCRHKVPALPVCPVIERTDQLAILLWVGLDFKGIDGAEIRCANQLVPVTIRYTSAGEIRNQRLQVFASVPVTQQRHHPLVGKQWDVFRSLYGIQVRKRGNRDPVVSPDAEIAAENDSSFTRP